jgi:hypothetical protein
MLGAIFEWFVNADAQHFNFRATRAARLKMPIFLGLSAEVARIDAVDIGTLRREIVHPNVQMVEESYAKCRRGCPPQCGYPQQQKSVDVHAIGRESEDTSSNEGQGADRWDKVVGAERTLTE